MNQSIRYPIFLLRRGSGEYLVLHPFLPGGKVFRTPGDVLFEGRFGTEPEPERLDSLRTLLHGELEKGARQDALDRGFYPRLFTSAAIFLGLYMFLSIVIRDPVPLIDELLVGTLGALAVWFALERKALASPGFVERITRLRGALDSALFQPSRVAREMEEVLQDAESLPPGLWAEFLSAAQRFNPPEEDARELEALEDALEARLPPEAVQDILRLVTEGSDFSSLTRGKYGGKRTDIPMLLSYARAKVLRKAKP